jgi:uncharacterized membrane protein
VINVAWKSLRNSFVAGLLVVVPVVASLALLVWFFTRLTDFILPSWVRDSLHGSPALVFLVRVLALVLALVMVTAVGWLMRLMVGRQLLLAVEGLIDRIPLLNKTYGFVKEISHTLLAGQKTVFQRVVLIQYPRPGVYAIGFVTNETSGEAQQKTQQTVVNVFLPTTPNPTSGFLLLVPKSEVVELEMSVAEGMKLVISGGAVVPPYSPRPASGSNVDGAR